jgi:hypothetical protein
VALGYHEIDVLRQIGEKYMSYASLPVQKEKLLLWKALNRCDMERPMVTIDQEPWNELEAADPEALHCQIDDPYWQGLERELRRTVYKWEHYPADMVLEPYITIPASVWNSGYGVTPLEDKLVLFENETASSHLYKDSLPNFEDIERIQDMHITCDRELSKEHLEVAEQIFNGLAPVRLSHGLQFHLGVWDRLAELRGVENIYFDIIDRPEFIHALMRRITDATLNGIREANALQVINDTVNICHCSYVYTDELLPDFGVGKGSVSGNSWAFGMAQLFTSVSPDVMREFELPYITEMASNFACLYYGCCDRLDDRLDIVAQIPHVRKVSCSPWSNRHNFAEKLNKKFIMSNKPSPAFLSGDDFDEAAVRADLKETIDAARANHVNLEFLLKDISTVRNDPSRLTRWNNVAMELVSK